MLNAGERHSEMTGAKDVGTPTHAVVPAGPGLSACNDNDQMIWGSYDPPYHFLKEMINVNF